MTILSDKEEQILLTAARQDISKFDKLYEYYKDRIFRYVRFRVNILEEAEDITSQTFLQAIECFVKYKNRGKRLGAWLYTIAGNLIRDWYRKKKPILLEVEELAKKTNFITETKIINQIDAEIQQKQMIFCINQLKEKEQQIIVLKVLEELNFKQIAEFLNQKESSIKMIYYRGLEKIKKIARQNFLSRQK